MNDFLSSAQDRMEAFVLVDISSLENKVAIKQIKGIFDKDYNETDWKRILREIKLLRRLDYPYIIKLFDVVEPKDLDNFQDVYLILELADSDLK